MTALSFKTHNEVAGISIGNTSLQGYVQANFSDLVELFGTQMDGDEYKTDAEWWVKFDDGVVATIYNYKDGINYMGEEEGIPTEEITNWHVGGKTNEAFRRVKSLLRKKEVSQ